MAWFKSLRSFTKRPDETDVIFEKLSIFLNSDSAQNAAMPDDLKSIITWVSETDIVPGATGEFGLSFTNPVPVNGPIGEVTYLSALELLDGRSVWAHRLGSRDRVDVFEVVSEDGKNWFILFLTPYFPRKSGYVPSGFRFRSAPRVRGISATNQFVSEFPIALPDAISDWTKSTLSIPLVTAGLREALRLNSFSRPLLHCADIEAFKLNDIKAEVKDARYILLKSFTHSKLFVPMLSVMRKNIGYETIDLAEVSFFCASMMTYCYLHFGPSQPDHVMLDTFHQMTIDDIVTAKMPQTVAVSLYQTRYQEYCALIIPVFDPEEDQLHHMTTLLMHVCERSSHETAQGRMMKIATAGPVIAALLDDAFKFAQRLARPRSNVTE